MKLLDSLAKFSQTIKSAFIEEWNKKAPTRIQTAQKNVREFANDFFKKTDTYRSLTQGGGLQGSFGFPSGEEDVIANWFIDTITNNLQIKSDLFRLNPGNIVGSVRLIIPYTVYDKLLNGLYSKIQIEGSQLYWTDWLLRRGDEIIIHDYHVVFEEREGRTGYAIMGKGGNWKVPAKYSGTINDNFITRTIYERQDFLDGISKILSRDLL